MLRIFLSVMACALLSACAGQRCDRVQAYQLVSPRTPLAVPSDLAEPRAVSKGPEVDPASNLRVRADGRCLEEPPQFEVAEGSAETEPAADVQSTPEKGKRRRPRPPR